MFNKIVGLFDSLCEDPLRTSGAAFVPEIDFLQIKSLV
jgi:hypothetical protein